MTGPVTLISESPEDPYSHGRAASVVLDRHGLVIGWSDRARTLVGWSAEEVLGRPAVEVLVRPEDHEEVLEATAACVRQRGWFGTVPVRTRDGRRLGFGIRARRVLRTEGHREWYLVAAPAEEVVQWEIDRSVMDGLFSRSPIGLSVHDTGLNILRINRAIARIGGITPEDARGHRIGDFLVEADARIVDAGLRKVLETGSPMIFTEQPCRLAGMPGKERYVSVSAFRMEDSAGRVLGVTNLVEDVTDRHRARRRLALLTEAGASVGTTLDVETTARELVRAAVPDLADCVSVDLLESVSRGEEPVPDGGAGPVLRTAYRTVTAETEHLLLPVGSVNSFPEDTPQARCLATGLPVLEPFIDVSETVKALGLGEPPAGYGVHSLMVVPLKARGLVLGFVCLWRSQLPEPFEEDDLTLANELAARAAISLDNARRFTQQHRAALALQRRLLPRELPVHPAVVVAHRYMPAGGATGVGGDWFDVIPLSGARVALVVGDVVGHGINAAATMGRLRTAVHTLADLDLDPDEVLSHLDDLVNRLAGEQEQDIEGAPGEQVVGATCLYAVYDPVSRRCTIARAGHPPPVVVTPEGEAAVADLPAGPPLGLGGLPFESAELELPEDSVLALYTNGLVEGAYPDMEAGLTELCAVMAGERRPVEEMAQAVVERMLPARPNDDVALLLARTLTLAPESVATWELPAEPTAPARARRLTADQLAAWGLEAMAFSTELIVSELVTNAYRYAGGGPLTLRLIHHQRLICEVSDTSSTSPHLRRARSTDEGGRGLLLVAQLTARWGTRHSREGKTVWTEQTFPPLPGGAGDDAAV
ncbi:SpoIIE family protein phosphatase [Streptomyces pristinaespiralis]|uniref:Protein phosphatase n=1 Tax=Streptomyces pristinaespiralis TaxID=38300 RepID=A0A0M4DBU8_STRPR|nr:SpoIIE family protein phosphatase [Streptomyces pristinaespiralis]ALC24928.1 protein phosphatase [Streptomyces pristinaespiralis]QMU12783.1 SpoIIE family protein phosphatase [Streptomyces pristinaespiralis]